jgi:hypothetical protein
MTTFLVIKVLIIKCLLKLSNTGIIKKKLVKNDLPVHTAGSFAFTFLYIYLILNMLHNNQTKMFHLTIASNGTSLSKKKNRSSIRVDFHLHLNPMLAGWSTDNIDP